MTFPPPDGVFAIMPNSGTHDSIREPRPGGRRVRYWLAAALVVAGGLYSAWWWTFADGLRNGIEQWRLSVRAGGIVVHWSGVELGGYPGRVELTFSEPSVVAYDTVRWRGDRLTLAFDPLDPGAVGFRAPGRHALDDLRGAQPKRWRVDADRLAGRLTPLDTGQALSVELGGAVIRQANAPVARVDRLSAVVKRFDGPEETDANALKPPPTIDLALDVSGGMAEPQPGWPIVETDQRIVVNAVLHGGLASPPNVANLHRWRDGGGLIEVGSMLLRAGSVSMTGDGTFSLDRNLQPVGAFSVRLEGFDAIIDSLVAGKRMTPNNAEVIKTIMGLLATRADNEGRRAIDGAFSLQDRQLFIGPIKLADVPPLVWPE